MMHYTLDFSGYHQHLVHVTLKFTAATAAPVLWLPSWIPGSYLMREFARNITRVDATIAAQATRCVKVTKNTWQLSQVNAGDQVSVTYEVYAYDLSVRSAYVDQTRLYGNFTSLALVVRGQEQERIAVAFGIPAAFEERNTPIRIACTLPCSATDDVYEFTAANYDALIDHPFEIAKQDHVTMNVMGKTHVLGQSAQAEGEAATPIPHEFVLSGTHHANLDRLECDLQKICQAYVDWMGDAPFDKYLFMTMATGNDYGGLEHQNSTSLITPRSDLPQLNEPAEPSKNYRRFLGLCSHEYFHAWWVKCVRPEVYLSPDLTQEIYTPLLWVFEGFTSYFDDLMLYRSGVVNADAYLSLLTEQINRYYQTHGRANQSVAESSFDAWIKLYRADENTANAGISYYNKGALVALCLDLTLKAHGKRLDDVVHACYARAKAGQRGLTDAVLDDIVGELMGAQHWQQFRADYIDGRKELPLNALLSEQGVTIKPKAHAWAFGMSTSKSDAGLKVVRTLRDGAAACAGISANDVLVALDSIKVTESVLKAAAKRNTPVRCHLFRRDELIELTLQPEEYRIEKVALSGQDDALLTAWLSFPQGTA